MDLQVSDGAMMDVTRGIVVELVRLGFAIGLELFGAVLFPVKNCVRSWCFLCHPRHYHCFPFYIPLCYMHLFCGTPNLDQLLFFLCFLTFRSIVLQRRKVCNCIIFIIINQSRPLNSFFFH